MSENLVQFAEIIEVRGGEAKVRLYRPTACSGCHGCGTGEGRNEVLTVRNPLDAAVGQAVRIELAPRSILQAAVIVYVLPLVLMVSGYLLGLALARALPMPWASDTVGVAVGLTALLFSFVLVRAIDRRAKGTGRFEPVISAVVAPEAAQELASCHTPQKQKRQG